MPVKNIFAHNHKIILQGNILKFQNLCYNKYIRVALEKPPLCQRTDIATTGQKGG